MESLFNQMAEFIKMEEELPFAEFQSYYTSVMAFLQKEYQDLTVDDLLKAKGILSIMGANAKTRALVKNENRKKFQKMAEKSAFWDDAITRRLVKIEGLSNDEVQEKVESLWE